MFLQKGSLSVYLRTPALLLAAVAFVFGLATGAGLGPLKAERGSASTTVEQTPPSRRAETSPSRYPAEVLQVSDGDTFQARVRIWPGIDITTLVRLRGIDTPELKAGCQEERAQAEAARSALATILAQGSVEISAVALDKFGGRVDADASTRSTPNVAAALLRAGVARSYTGGRRESWCAQRMVTPHL